MYIKLKYKKLDLIGKIMYNNYDLEEMNNENWKRLEDLF